MLDPKRCHQVLRNLAVAIHDRVSHWQALPYKVHLALEHARSIATQPQIGSSTRCAAELLINSLQIYDEQPQLDYRAVVCLRQDLERLRERLRQISNDTTLREVLHSTIEQHISMAAAGPERLHQRFEAAVGVLRSVSTTDAELLSTDCQRVLGQFGEGSLKVSDLAGVGETLERIIQTLPRCEVSPISPVARITNSRRFRIAVVEDEELWQGFVLQSLDHLREQLGRRFTIEIVVFDNAREARDALLSAAEVRGKSKEDQQTQPIAILDMGLPADFVEATAARQAKSLSRRTTGHALLRELRSYKANIPVIVLTTPPNLLDDQVQVCEQGIEDCDFILKGPDKQDHLIQSILRVIERSQAHRIEIQMTPRPQIFVDDARIALEEMPFRTFYALCQLSQQSRMAAFPPERILHQLDETFGDVYDYKRSPHSDWERAQVLARERSGTWWRSDQAVDVANVIRLWTVRKRHAQSDLNKAFETLRSDYVVWRNALQLFDRYRRAHPNRDEWAGHSQLDVDRLPPVVIATGFDSVFGGFEIETRSDYDLKNIEKHIHEIRLEIHSGLKQVHRFIEPREEVVVRRMVGEQYGYRVLGEIITRVDNTHALKRQLWQNSGNSSEKGIQLEEETSKTKVLLVENEPLYSERMRSLLLGAGFSVRVATNLEDAISEARGLCRPDILSLDLHIPATREEFERDPMIGDPFNGLRALEQIRQDVPGIRVVIPTTLYNRDELREWATRLGVRVSEFVPKGESTDGAPWEGHFLLTLTRMREELRTRAVLPPLPPWRCPVIHILRESDVAHGRLHLKVNGRLCPEVRGKQAKLLSVLLAHGGETVSHKEIDMVVYGREATLQERKQLLKNVRAKIRKNWLSLQGNSNERQELEILESVDGGLILHAYVEGDLGKLQGYTI